MPTLITSCAWLVLRKTALAYISRAVGINKKASRIAGINSERIIFLCYVVCGLCAGIAGIVASSRINFCGFQQHRTELRAGCDSGSCHRRKLPRRRKVPAGRLYYRCVHHPGDHHHPYALGISTEQAPVYKAVIVIIIVAIQAPPFKAFMKKCL